MRSILAAIAGVFAVIVVSRRRRIYLRTGARLARRMFHIASLLRSRRTGGALISRIGTGSPAEKAGLEIGDVVIRFAGNKVEDSAQFRKFVADAESGIDARVDVMRNGRRKSFIVTIAKSAPKSAPTDQSSHERD